MNYKETYQNQGAKSEYRQNLADVLGKIKNYQGKQSQSDEIIQTLIDLENWMKKTFDIDEGRVPESVETDTLDNWHPSNVRRSISDLLALTSCRYERCLDRNGLKDFLVVESDDIILPPDCRKAGVVRGGKNGVEDPRFQERIKQLLLLLEQNGIYSDDIILIKGEVADSMMRKESYLIVEIPKLNREVLINNQVGEATFVVYGIQSRQVLVTESKDDLQERLGSQITKIVYGERSQWEIEIINALFKDVNIDDLKKIDVKTLEGLRATILKQKSTPQDWADMSLKERRAFKIASFGIKAIATRFGAIGAPANRLKDHLELGKRIYGEEHKCLQYEEHPELTKEELRKEILKRKPFPEDWVAMEGEEKKSIQNCWHEVSSNCKKI